MNFITLADMLKPDTSVAFTATVVIAGLGIVLATLALLILIFQSFGNLVYKSQNAAEKKKKKSEKAKITVAEVEMPSSDFSMPSAPAVQPAVEEGISEEVVAAISAAVYMMQGSDAVVCSIKRKNNPITSRNPWAQAAVIENTQPF